MRSVAVFATSEAALEAAPLNRSDLIRLMGGEQGLQNYLIHPILRPPADADNQMIIVLAPEIASVLDHARSRSGALVASSHQEALEWGEKVKGSLVLASIDSIKAEKRALFFLHYQGEDPRKIDPALPHPLVRTYYLFHSLSLRPAAQAWIDFLRGPEAAEVLNGLGAAPITGQAGHGC
jgi:hypothetical protein